MKTIAGLTMFALSLAALPAQAQSRPDSDRAQFIDMGEVIIDGQVARPATLVIDIHSRPIWRRLFNLKKSMRPALVVTEKDAALR